MATEKLFTPEDFDKPKDKCIWQKYKSPIIAIAAILIIAAVFLYCVFFSKTEEKGKVTKPEYKEQVSDTTQNNVYANVTEAIETQISEESKEKEIKSTDHSPSAKISEPKIRKDFDISKTSTKTFDISDDIELEAMNVIRGDYGNVPERRRILGSKYQKIQNRVNQLKKEGVF